MNKFFSDFKEMFKSSDNVKLIAAIVLILFIALFVVFGGCTGCGCAGCVDVSCGGCETAGGSGGGAAASSMYSGMEVSATSVIDEYSNVAATVYYPVDIYTATENSSEFWAYWCGDAAVYAEGKFSVQPNLEYFSNSYTADGASCASFEEVREANRARYGENPLTFGEIKIGEYNAFWRVYGGLLTVYLPVDNGGNQLLEVHVVPPELDQNASDATDKASALIKDKELLAILGAIEITTTDAIPDASTIVF